ncbi:hypothetical protein OG897_02320 [Streptomyces sp. NBC_00237]|uniref:hypothetical protein n=1 Tax=Streptomyces sp. NBC_00237 TaxID=2975687 RepID=UPI0022500EB6|nr:hypothetical protein [Streptomyces sp. NBC_00237]MCX5200300.1 hypothetical protein [Streptomyces sp. NBC_00237]
MTGLFIALGVMVVVLVAIFAKVRSTPDPNRYRTAQRRTKRRRTGSWASGGSGYSCGGGSSCGGSSSCGGGGGGGGGGCGGGS